MLRKQVEKAKHMYTQYTGVFQKDILNILKKSEDGKVEKEKLKEKKHRNIFKQLRVFNEVRILFNLMAMFVFQEF